MFGANKLTRDHCVTVDKVGSGAETTTTNVSDMPKPTLGINKINK